MSCDILIPKLKDYNRINCGKRRKQSPAAKIVVTQSHIKLEFFIMDHRGGSILGNNESANLIDSEVNIFENYL